jgi:hypothetical protein
MHFDFRETKTYHTNVPIHCCNPFVCIGFEEFRGDDLLDCQDHAVFAPDAYCCPSILDGLDCILDLKVSAVG